MKKNHFAGWICKKHKIAWVVSGYRKDKRTGVVRSENDERDS